MALYVQRFAAILSSAITCASVALANAAIEMYDLVAACSVAHMAGEKNLVDPTALEEQQQAGNITVAFMPSLNEVTQLYQEGEIHQAKVQEVHHTHRHCPC